MMLLGIIVALIPFALFYFAFIKDTSEQLTWAIMVLVFVLGVIIPLSCFYYKNPTEVHEDFVLFPFGGSIYHVEYEDIREVRYYGHKGKPYDGSLALIFVDGHKASIGNNYDDFPELCRTVIDRTKKANPQVIINKRAKKYLYFDSLK